MWISEIFRAGPPVILNIQVTPLNVVTEPTSNNQELKSEDLKDNVDIGSKEDVIEEIVAGSPISNYANIKISALTTSIVDSFILVNKSLF